MGNRELTVQRGTKPNTQKRTGTWITPAVDIFENEEVLTLVADLPGVERSDLQIGIENDILTIEGAAADRNEAFYTEFSSAGYYRRFQLPDHLDLEKIGAELSNGVLTLRMPKAAAARPHRIEVTVH